MLTRMFARALENIQKAFGQNYRTEQQNIQLFEPKKTLISCGFWGA